MTETSALAPVHVTYSPITFMNHQWTINLHDGYLPLHVLLPEEYISPSLPTLCNLKSTMFHFGVDLLHSITERQHDLPSLASPKGEMARSFSWTNLFKSPTSSTLCFGDPTLEKLDQVKLLCETDFCITKSIPLCHPVVHTGTMFLLTSKTLPYKPKMYLQDKPSTPSSEVPSGETEKATSIHLIKVYKSLSHGTKHTSAFDQVLSINWQMNAMLLTQVPCPVTSTFYPGPKLLALLDHTFAEYLFLCLIEAHGKTSLCGSHQVPLDYGQTKLLQTFCKDDSYDNPMISDLPQYDFRSFKFYFVWYIQHLIVADATFSVPRSSSYTHQASDCHSNLVTIPSSSIYWTSQSVSHISLPFLSRIFLILDKLKIVMTKDSLHHTGKNGEHSYGENLCNTAKNGEHSCVENFHGEFQPTQHQQA